MAAHPEIVRIACQVKPDQATLVPERRAELTTEGGLDLSRNVAQLDSAIRRLRAVGIRISLFVDPNPRQIQQAAKLAVPMIELHTGRYAHAKKKQEVTQRLREIKEAVRMARSAGIIVAAGHGLDYQNVRPVAEIPEVEELNIGFSIVARAMEAGFPQAVREMAVLVHGKDRPSLISQAPPRVLEAIR